jgi:hypothetical protein
LFPITASPPCAQRDSLQEQPGNEDVLLLGEHLIFWMKDTGPATPFAAVIFLAGVHVPVSLVHLNLH